MARRPSPSHSHRLVTGLGAAALAAGLTGLAWPVMLADYDTFGIQIDCGSGLHAQLLQASVDDGQPSAPPQSRVGQCHRALAHRRSWALPAGGIGAVVLLGAAAAWVRRPPAPGPEPPHGPGWGVAHPDDDMHDAAALDRRDAEHRAPPDNTVY